MLVKFKILEVEEKSYDQKFHKGLDFKHEYHETWYDYLIRDTEGNTYRLNFHHKPVTGLIKGKTIYSSVFQIMKPGFSLELEPNQFEIKYYNTDRQGIMTPQKFAIEVKKDIEQRKKEITWCEQEISRLESLLAS